MQYTLSANIENSCCYCCENDLLYLVIMVYTYCIQTGSDDGVCLVVDWMHNATGNNNEYTICHQLSPNNLTLERSNW